MTAYGASKAAVASYTRHVAVQYGRRNIRCNAISPGLIMTPHVMEATPVPVREALAKHITTPRLGKPEDVGYLAAFLASDASGYINGQVITVDGGVSARFPRDADVLEAVGGQRDSSHIKTPSAHDFAGGGPFGQDSPWSPGR